MDLEPAQDSAIPRQSLTSAVADKLREQIIRGELAEGALLRQDAIATQFRVSRIPVREALRQLDAEGLIAIVPNRGAVVPALSPDDVEELFLIRALLEPEVLKLSIPRLTEEDLSEAASILRKYVSELRREDHLSSWGRLNWQFHSILTHGMKRANEEHHQILEFCRQRDVEGACKLLRQHIEHAGESLKHALEQKRAAAPEESQNGNRRSKA
jgi:DNA-binding GntR family transcriptional regulator